MRRVQNPGTKLFVLCIYTVIILFAFYLKLPCIWKYLFGVPCPGCGMTRAVFSAINGDFGASFSFHPMVFSLPLLLLYFIFDGRLFRRKAIDSAVLWMLLAGFLAQWVWKLFMW